MKKTRFPLLLVAIWVAGCASVKLQNHASNIDAVQLSVSFVEAKAKLLTTPTLDIDLIETMAMDPVFAVGKAGVLEKQMSQPAQVRQSAAKLMTETITAFTVAESRYTLDSRIPLYGYVDVEDERAGRFYVVVDSSLKGPQGQLWKNRTMGVSPKTSFAAVSRGEMNLQEGLNLALSDASAKIDAALKRDSQRPQ